MLFDLTEDAPQGGRAAPCHLRRPDLLQVVQLDPLDLAADRTSPAAVHAVADQIAVLQSPMLTGWGYGPVVDGGYGLAYSVNDRSLRFTITSTNSTPGETVCTYPPPLVLTALVLTPLQST